jgi:hypothetical protein
MHAAARWRQSWFQESEAFEVELAGNGATKKNTKNPPTRNNFFY